MTGLVYFGKIGRARARVLIIHFQRLCEGDFRQQRDFPVADWPEFEIGIAFGRYAL